MPYRAFRVPVRALGGQTFLSSTACAGRGQRLQPLVTSVAVALGSGLYRPACGDVRQANSRASLLDDSMLPHALLGHALSD